MNHENHSSAKSRRDFLKVSLAAGGAIALSSIAATSAIARRADPAPGKKLHILILGGTGFIGPHMVEAALARGHTITIFNRGKREKLRKEVGLELPWMDKVEVLYGNRDPSKHADDKDDKSPLGLESLKGKTFDAVIDNSGYFLRDVKASADLLAAAGAKHYLFISSISAYAKNDKPNMDESDELAKLADPNVDNMGAQGEFYGGLKVVCEQAVEKAFPGKCALVRPGFIVGPGDSTDRFTYWVVRADKGGEMLLPGTPEVPIQFIDARDLAAFCMDVTEQKLTGAYNATGPQKPLPSGDFFKACIDASTNKPTPVWIPVEFLEKQTAPVDLTIWIPNAGEAAGFHTRIVDKAVKAGLKFRPVDVTVKDTLAWFKTLPADRQAKLRAGMTMEREAEVIKAWKESQEKKS